MQIERIQCYKPASCPKCNGSDIRFIINGRPSSEGYAMIEQKVAVKGSCIMTPDRPDWHCASCQHTWFNPEDPERVEMMALLAKIRQKFDAKK